jgi:hypothetical protein
MAMRAGWASALAISANFTSDSLYSSFGFGGIAFYRIFTIIYEHRFIMSRLFLLADALPIITL